MGLKSWLWNNTTERHAQPSQQHDNLVAVVSPWKANRELPPAHDYDALCRDGYERNPIVWGCIDAIASSCAAPDLQVMRTTPKGPELVDPMGDMMRLLNKPSVDEDQFEFLYRLLVYYCIAGEVYVHKVRSASDKIVQLQILRPDRIKPVPNAKGQILRYSYEIDGTKIEDILPRNILPIRRLHPRNDFRGLSPISVAARFIDLDNQGADFLRSLLNNGGIPRGLLKLKQKTTPDQRSEVKQQWRERYGSDTGWNELAVIDEDADYTKMGITPEESDLGNIFGETESRICITFGVPPIIVSAKIGLDRSTYSNYESAMRSFWQHTLAPIFSQLAARFTHGIITEFDPDAYCTWNYENVEAMRESRDAVSTRVRAEWQAGLITLNEARAQLGAARMVDGDVLRTDAITMFEPALTEVQSKVHDNRVQEYLHKLDLLIEQAVVV